MNKQISKQFSRLSLLAFGLVILATFLAPQVSPSGGVVYADTALPACKLGQTPKDDKCSLEACDPSPTATTNKCACDPALQSCSKSSGCVGADCGLIRRYFNPVINFLTAVVGIVVTIAIIVGGIQYSTSADDPQKVAAAKARIINAVLAMLAFIFLWAFLQWLVPGGVFNS